MLRKILFSVVAVVLIIVGYAATKPNQFHVERSLTMPAAPQTVFAMINDFHQWPNWSPFEKLDPQMKRTFGGTEKGSGAFYEWSGDKEVGAGRMEIVESTAPSHITIKMDFVKPFEGHSVVEFTVKPEGKGSTVTWAMHGPQSLPEKVMCLFMDMDKMVGGPFAEGLENLRKATSPSDLVITRTLDAPVTAVWKAWTQPKDVMRWWGPKVFTAPVAKIDFRVGGKYLLAMKDPDGKLFWSTGTYKAIEPLKRIDATDSFSNAKGDIVNPATYGMGEDFPAEALVITTFEATPEGKTLLTVKYPDYPMMEMRGMMTMGWNESLDKLAAVVAPSAKE